MKKTVGRPFKKGQSGNPSGRPKLDPELKELRVRSREDVEKIILQMYALSESELKKIIDNPETIFWERHIARIILKGVAKGDQISFGFLSDYIFGERPKVSKLEVDNKNPSMIQPVVVVLPAKE